MNAKELIGQKFGRLTVVARGENAPNGKARWICDCDCGKRKEKSVTTYDLVSGKVKSCGCLYKESNEGRNITHGRSRSRLYRIWLGMKRRCKVHENYCGKGVSVCEEWNEFKPFYDWSLANGYIGHLTIDRKDNNKGYSPDNCRWATMKEQQNNRTNNIRITVNGEEKTISEWSEITGIRKATLEWRVKHQWAENELFMPVNLNNARIRKGKTSC